MLSLMSFFLFYRERVQGMIWDYENDIWADLKN